MNAPPIEELIGKRTLIVGDVGAGKTRLTQDYVAALAGEGLSAIYVLDLAPAATLSDGTALGQPVDVAGFSNVSCIRVSTIPPRLTTEVEEIRFKIAQDNARRIEETGLKRLPVKGADAIVVNDASLFLQGDEPARLLKYLEGAKTVIVNAYLGTYFGTGPFSRRERERVEDLGELVDLVVRL